MSGKDPRLKSNRYWELEWLEKILKFEVEKVISLKTEYEGYRGLDTNVEMLGLEVGEVTIIKN